MEDGGQAAFLPREEWAARPGEESRRRRRCSKGSSGEAIPCQPKPLKRRHWARVTLDREPWRFPDFPDRAENRARRHSVRLHDVTASPDIGNGDAPCSGLIELPGFGPPLSSLRQVTHSRTRSTRLPPRPTQAETREAGITTDHSACLVTAEPSVPAPFGTCRAGLGRRRSYRRTRLHCVQEAAAMIAAPSSETTGCHALGGMVVAAMPWTA